MCLNVRSSFKCIRQLLMLMCQAAQSDGDRTVGSNVIAHIDLCTAQVKAQLSQLSLEVIQIYI